MTSGRVLLSGWWHRLVLLLLLLPAAGCHPQPGLEDVRERLVLTEDFEQLAGWIPNANGLLTTERAHSGRYSLKADKQHPFSPGFCLTLGHAFVQRPRRLRLSAWVWVEGPAEDARLMLTIGPAASNAAPLHTAYLYVADYWPHRRWTHISRDVVLPPGGYPSSSQLTLYLWHFNAEHPVYTDDWQLTELR